MRVKKIRQRTPVVYSDSCYQGKETSFDLYVDKLYEKEGA